MVPDESLVTGLGISCQHNLGRFCCFGIIGDADRTRHDMLPGNKGSGNESHQWFENDLRCLMYDV